jgi:hypothetical protein
MNHLPGGVGVFVRRPYLRYMASQEGIRKTYTCLCQRTNGQAVCVDVKLLGTTEGCYQHSATLVLLNEYGRFLDAYIMGI